MVRTTLDGLKATLEAFQSNWKEQDERAERGRKYVYDKVEGLGSSMLDLTHQVKTVVSDVTEMKPAVRDWVETKQQALGAKTAAGAFGKVIYMIGGALLFMAGWLIDHLPIIINAIK